MINLNCPWLQVSSYNDQLCWFRFELIHSKSILRYNVDCIFDFYQSIMRNGPFVESTNYKLNEKIESINQKYRFIYYKIFVNNQTFVVDHQYTQALNGWLIIENHLNSIQRYDHYENLQWINIYPNCFPAIHSTKGGGTFQNRMRLKIKNGFLHTSIEQYKWITGNKPLLGYFFAWWYEFRHNLIWMNFIKFFFINM